jgi:hypothetical protein
MTEPIGENYEFETRISNIIRTCDLNVEDHTIQLIDKETNHIIGTMNPAGWTCDEDYIKDFTEDQKIITNTLSERESVLIISSIQILTRHGI